MAEMSSLKRSASLLLAVAGLAGCATAHSGHSARSDRAEGKTGALPPVIGFRVHARDLTAVPGYIQVAASHRSRRYRVEKITLIGPGGRLLQPVSLQHHRHPAYRGHVFGHAGGVVGIGTGGIGTGGIGTGGIGIGIGAPVNFEALLDPVFFPQRSPWRSLSVATVKFAAAGIGAGGAGGAGRWRVRVALADRQGNRVNLERPLKLHPHGHGHWH